MRALGAVLLAAFLTPPVEAIDLEVSSADIARALRIARGRDEDVARAAAPYVRRLPGPLVHRVEVVTEFRRMLLIAEERRRAGDWMFLGGMRAAREALAPWKQVVTIVATLESAAWISVPRIELLLTGTGGDGTIPARASRVTPQYSLGSADTPAFLIGAAAEADYEAALVGQHTRVLTVLVEGQPAAHLPIDFAALE